VWIALLFASAGVFHHAGIKIPYFAFFAHDSGKRCREAPWNMLLAMALSAALCIAIGSFPETYYLLLPFSSDFEPYSSDHVVSQVQLLFWSALAFTLLMRTGIYPPELVSTNLDFDWFYRRLGRDAARSAGQIAASFSQALSLAASSRIVSLVELLRSQYSAGRFSKAMSYTGTMVFWTTLMLAAYLLISYL
jgi:multicomponent Na+:H+ antiporter subunit D